MLFFCKDCLRVVLKSLFKKRKNNDKEEPEHKWYHGETCFGLIFTCVFLCIFLCLFLDSKCYYLQLYGESVYAMSSESSPL